MGPQVSLLSRGSFEGNPGKASHSSSQDEARAATEKGSSFPCILVCLSKHCGRGLPTEWGVGE